MAVLATLSESWLYGCAGGAATAAVLPRRLRGCGMLQYRRWQGFGGAVGLRGASGNAGLARKPRG